MKEFLKKLSLNENAIKIYTQILGRPPLIFEEIHSIVPELSREDLSKIIKDLTEADLFVKIVPKSSEVLLHYFAIPPFNPILNYYLNINSNLPNIKDAVYGLMISSLNNIFTQKENIDLSSLFNRFIEVKKDFKEDAFIQKEDVADLIKRVKRIERLKDLEPNLKTVFDDLHQKIKGITQTQFANLIKVLTAIKTEINEKINTVEFKKSETSEMIIRIVEDSFKSNLQTMLDEFSVNLNKLIEEEFEKLNEPLENNILKPFEKRLQESKKNMEELNTLYVNLIQSFEKKIHSIESSIEDEIESLEIRKKTLKETILLDLKEIVYDALNQVAGLNIPIENLLKDYINNEYATKYIRIDQLWKVGSQYKIKEELLNIISNSNQNITIILPKIKNYIRREQFIDRSDEIRVKIASSDPHSNSLVEKLSELENITFKKITNQHIILVNGDGKQLIIGVIKEDSAETLENFFGIATNNERLIKLLSPVVESIWLSGGGKESFLKEKKSFEQIPSSKQFIAPEKSRTFISENTRKTPSKLKPTRADLSSEKIKTEGTIKQNKSGHIENGSLNKKEPPKEGPKTNKSKTSPLVAKQITGAFQTLINTINQMKGNQFSNNLQEIADLILEKKGFSVTLHDISRTINDYKLKDDILTDEDIQHIMDKIESWRKKLL